ncbi:hypothetical protein AAG608_13560 [Citromicrobium bathyomarinum]
MLLRERHHRLSADGRAGGSALAVDGVARGYRLQNNQPIAILTGGRRYVHKMAEPLRIGSSGAGTLEIEPPLRIEPADDAVVEIARPSLEGLLEAPIGGEFEVDQFMSGMSLTIVEVR